MFEDTRRNRSSGAEKYEVTWYERFALAEMLETHQKVTRIEEVGKLPEAEWYSPFEVVKPLEEGAPVVSVADCRDYFRHPDKDPVIIPEYKPYLFIGLMCRVAELISQAKAAEHSWIEDLSFDQHLPDRLPKQLAAVISSSEYERINNDVNITHWGDVYKITRYHDEGGSQLIELLARGDFNSDGIEDMVIMSTDAVVGGSYSANRLFIISRKSPAGELEVLREYRR